MKKKRRAHGTMVATLKAIYLIAQADGHAAIRRLAEEALMDAGAVPRPSLSSESSITCGLRKALETHP